LLLPSLPPFLSAYLEISDGERIADEVRPVAVLFLQKVGGREGGREGGKEGGELSIL
jgi:hypothetical protein